jgi:hypothetical protein
MKAECWCIKDARVSRCPLHDGEEMTGEDKIRYIEKQMIACQQERQNAINCPYCDSQNIEGSPLCCELFARAVAAIMVNKDDKIRAEHAERILEKVQAN